MRPKLFRAGPTAADMGRNARESPCQHLVCNRVGRTVVYDIGQRNRAAVAVDGRAVFMELDGLTVQHRFKRRASRKTRLGFRS